MNEPHDPLWRLAERRIREAIEHGEFDDLPTAGRPLVPQELRVACRLLKNAGFVPEEVRLRRELHESGALLAHIEDDAERIRAARRLEMLRLRLGAAGHEVPMSLEPDYRVRLLGRMSAG